MGKGKMKTNLKTRKETISVKLNSYSRPQFAHNAKSAGKGMTWTYSFWKNTDPSNKGAFDIEGDTGKLHKKNENDQSKEMNDAAISFIEGHYKGCDVKLVK